MDHILECMNDRDPIFKFTENENSETFGIVETASSAIMEKKPNNFIGKLLQF